MIKKIFDFEPFAERKFYASLQCVIIEIVHIPASTSNLDVNATDVLFAFSPRWNFVTD